MEQTFLTVFGVIIFIVLSPFYLLPSILAYKGKHVQKHIIIIVNFCAIGIVVFGVLKSDYLIGIIPSLILYLFLLAWAVKGEAKN